MKVILESIIKAIGLDSALLFVWGYVYTELQKVVKKTQTDFDDKALIVLNDLINSIAKQLKTK